MKCVKKIFLFFLILCSAFVFVGNIKVNAAETYGTFSLYGLSENGTKKVDAYRGKDTFKFDLSYTFNQGDSTKTPVYDSSSGNMRCYPGNEGNGNFIEIILGEDTFFKPSESRPQLSFYKPKSETSVKVEAFYTDDSSEIMGENLTHSASYSYSLSNLNPEKTCRKIRITNDYECSESEYKDHYFFLNNIYIEFGTYSFNVNFNSFGGSEVTSLSDVAMNAKISEPSPFTPPSGYILCGWYKDNSCTQRWDFDVDTVTSDLTLYASYIKINEYKDGYVSDFCNLKTKGALKVNYHQTVNPNHYELIKAIENLNVGDKVVIGTVASFKTLGAIVDNAGVAVSSVFNASNDLVEIGESTSIFTLSKKGSSWIFTNDNNDRLSRYAPNDSTLTLNGASDTWQITISGNNARIKEESDDVSIKYDTLNNRFVKGYNTDENLQDVQLYKVNLSHTYSINNVTIEDETITGLSLRFGTQFTKETINKIAHLDIEFGVFYQKTSNLMGKSIEYYVKEGNLAKLEKATCEEFDDESNIEFAVVIDGVPLHHLGTEVTAACYMMIEGSYYLMDEINYSVNSIAEAYLAQPSEVKETYKNHVEMLSWLKDYNG